MEIQKQLSVTATSSGMIGAVIGASIIVGDYHIAAFAVSVSLFAFVQLGRFRSLDDLDGPVHEVLFAQIFQPFLVAGLAIIVAMATYSISDTNEDMISIALSLGLIFQIITMLVLGLRLLQHVWSHPGVARARELHGSVFWMFLMAATLILLQVVGVTMI
ncbi:hypothetical protein V8J82_19210 [Gymnodinialimonas sp. 2305UL16-5]|uniref:hypothetical protein n=1 Tax=Gymnodinialimonas mytili TaxID=3126503 RepID=UPI0030A73C99